MNLISRLVQAVILGLIGWAIYICLGMCVAFSFLFAVVILWLLGLKVYTDSRLSKIDILLFDIISEIRSGKIKE
jgi:hypothetical protein